ncbi:MAG: sensor domain-containing diguanylate cyclase [Rhodospirillales bacterium]|nr:sensor domain-containing diguanylate cyclase [Rhodospirillales bacterium]
MPSGEIDQISILLNGYPDAAMMVRGDGSVIAANEKGLGLKALFEHGEADPIPDMIQKAAVEKTVVVGPVLFKGIKGEILLEISVMPQVDPSGMTSGDLLVLSHDVTMERNLRSALVESRQRYKDLVEVSSDFAWEVDENETFCFVSPDGALGFLPDDIIGRHPKEFIIDAEQYQPLPFLSDRALDNVEVWMKSSTRKDACVVVSCLPLSDENGKWCGARGICRNVTEERQREAALRSAQEREYLLGYIVNSIRDELDPLNMLTKAATATSQALGASGCRIYRKFSENEFNIAAEYGDTANTAGIEALLGQIGEEIGARPAEIGPWRVLVTSTHYRQAINGGICIWKPIDSEDWDDNLHILIGDVANQIGIANEQIANHERIINLSRTDSMTGLLNRRAFFEEELPRRFKRLEHNRKGAALFYLDLDNFKMVNDVHGHQKGDEAILCLRDMMIEFSRPRDAMVRMGGDEFALWMDGMSTDVMIQRVETILKASECLRQFSGDDEHPLGVSIGVAQYDPDSGENLESLVARADAAMYEVKRAGKGGYHVARPCEPGNSGEAG